MSGLRSRYAPVRSDVLGGGYVSIDGKQKQVEYSGLGYVCKLVGACLLFALGVLGAIAFGFVLRNNSDLHELQKQVAELEMVTPAPPAPAADVGALNALQSQVSDMQEGVNAVHSLYNSLVHQFGTLRENVFALRNGRGGDDDDSSYSSSDFSGSTSLPCIDDTDCSVAAPCRQGECSGTGSGGQCVLSQADQGTSCIIGQRPGTCNAVGRCVPSQGCLDAEAFTGWFQYSTPTFFLSPSALDLVFEKFFENVLHITVEECNDDNFTLSAERLFGTSESVRKPSGYDNLGRPTYTFVGKGEVALSELQRGAFIPSFYNFVQSNLSLSIASTSPDAELILGDIRPPLKDTDQEFNNFLRQIREPDVFIASEPSSIDFSNPVYQIDYLVSWWQDSQAFSSALTQEGGVDKLGMDLALRALKRGPSPTFSAHATHILKSTNAPFTLVYTIDYLPISDGSVVTISGLTGAWSVLNGEQQLSYFQFYIEHANHAANDAFYSADSRLQNIVLAYNSFALPTYNQSIHGKATVSYVVPQITPTMSYREMYDAASYLFLLASPLGNTHERLDGVGSTWFGVPATISETYADAQALLDANAANHFNLRLGNKLESPSLYRAGFSTLGIYINQPFSDLGKTSSIPGFYDVDVENYLQPETIQWLWYRFKPNSPVTNDIQAAVAQAAPVFNENGYYAVTSQSGLLTPGNPEGGSQMEGFLGPAYSVGNGTNPITGQPDLLDSNGNPLFVSPLNTGLVDPLEQFIGVVRPSLVGGRKYGYIRVSNTNLYDRIRFADNENVCKTNSDCLGAVFAPVFQYFNSYVFDNEPAGVDGIILDTRLNSGGNRLTPLFESFGADRKYLGTNYAFGGNRNNKLRNLNGSTVFSLDANGDITPEIIQTQGLTTASLTESRFPGGTFQNGTLIILTSVASRSGGDFASRLAQGDNLDGDLGSLNPGQKVQSYIVGNLHGILMGSSAGFGRKGVTADASSANPALRSSSGTPYPPLLYAPEMQNAFTLVGEESLTHTRLDMRGNIINAVRPVNSGIQCPLYNTSKNIPQGTNGIQYRALSSELFDVAYFDFGYTGPGGSFNGFSFADGHWDSVANNGPTGLTRVQLPSGTVFPDQPVADPVFSETWRDSWLEEALRVAQLHTHGNLVVDSGSPTILAQTPATAAAQTSLHSTCDSAAKLGRAMADLQEEREDYKLLVEMVDPPEDQMREFVRAAQERANSQY